MIDTLDLLTQAYHWTFIALAWVMIVYIACVTMSGVRQEIAKRRRGQ